MNNIKMEYWEKFVFNGDQNINIRKPILESWIRCKKSGLSHELNQAKFHEDNENFLKRQKKNRFLLEVARPVMKEIFSYLEGDGYLIVLTDKDGYLLEVIGDDKGLAMADEGRVFPGAKWMEENVGTSGLSIAIKKQIAIVTSAYEHYSVMLRNWDSAACPIKVDGNFFGVFDICRLGPRNDFSEFGAFAASGALAISSRIKYQQLKIKDEIMSKTFNRLYQHDMDDVGIITFDQEGNIVFKNKKGAELVNTIKKNKVFYAFNQNQSIFNYIKESFQENEIILGEHKQKFYVQKEDILYLDDRISQTYIFKNKEEIKGNQPIITFSSFKTNETSLNKILNNVKKVVNSDSPILIQGESGTGKDFLARAIHYESKRKNKPFIAINCASLPKDLIFSELFGYAPGAFTGANKNGHSGKIELANEGTLFLDEIADMPLDLQAILLRTLEENQITKLNSTKPIPVNVRYVAATHKNLKEMVLKGLFREDLYYRLNVFNVVLPPLRERKEDIEIIINNMLAEGCRKVGRDLIVIDDAAIEFLKNYSWPGNLRELRTVVERIIFLHDDNIIKLEDINGFIDQNEYFVKCEKERILDALAKANGNRTEAAKKLNISRSALYRKMKKYKISD